MNTPNYFLILGGTASLLIAMLHIFLTIRPQIYGYFNAAELAQMHANDSAFPMFVSIGLALMFAGWGIYAFSGAGMIRPLPFLKAVLITVGIIDILRGLMLPSEVIEVLKTGHSFRFVIMSTGCLVIGALHVWGSFVR